MASLAGHRLALQLLCARSPPLSLPGALLLLLGFRTADGGKYLSELAGMGGEGSRGRRTL